MWLSIRNTASWSTEPEGNLGTRTKIKNWKLRHHQSGIYSTNMVFRGIQSEVSTTTQS